MPIKLKSIYIKYKIMIDNIIYMNMLKILTLTVPILVYPYLISVLGSEKLGLVIWIWAIMELFIVFINFAFEISITKHISLNRDNLNKISIIFSSVLYAKLFLLTIILLISFILVNFVPLIKENITLFYVTFLIVLPELIMPLWYFRGIEKMKFVAYFTSFVKLGYTGLIFLFIHAPSDYIYVPILYALSGFLSALGANYYIYKNGIYLQKVSLQRIYFYINESLPLFGSNAIYTIREKMNIFFVEYFIGISSVAYFDLIQKFINILITPFHIVSSTIYPYIVKTKDIQLLKKIILLSLFSSVILLSNIYYFNNEIILLLLKIKSSELSNILNIMSVGIIANILNSFLGLNILSVFNKSNKLFKSSLFATFGYSLIVYLILINYKIDFVAIAITVQIVYVLEALLKIYYSKALLNNRATLI